MLVPALHFPGTCNEAIEFYKKVFGAEVMGISRYSDAPADSGYHSEETADWVMHGEISIAGVRVNVCDVVEEVVAGNMYLLNLFLPTADEVTAAYQELKEGGEVLIELGPQFWTPMYADVVDKFGVHWQLMANQG